MFELKFQTFNKSGYKNGLKILDAYNVSLYNGKWDSFWYRSEKVFEIT